MADSCEHGARRTVKAGGDFVQFYTRRLLLQRDDHDSNKDLLAGPHCKVLRCLVQKIR